jgi:hypothetical protein
MFAGQEKSLVYHISHSHLYWGRKSVSGLSRVLDGLGPGDIFLDPFYLLNDILIYGKMGLPDQDGVSDLDMSV